MAGATVEPFAYGDGEFNTADHVGILRPGR
jgi:hypothetical protein